MLLGKYCNESSRLGPTAMVGNASSAQTKMDFLLYKPVEEHYQAV